MGGKSVLPVKPVDGADFPLAFSFSFRLFYFFGTAVSSYISGGANDEIGDEGGKAEEKVHWVYNQDKSYFVTKLQLNLMKDQITFSFTITGLHRSMKLCLYLCHMKSCMPS